MSRIGKLPVSITKGVKVELKDDKVIVSGPKGTLEQKLRPEVTVSVDGNNVVVTRKDDTRPSKEMHGLYRVLINNMVTGVSTGFTKKLELVGVGYKAEIKKDMLVLSLGFSHQIYFKTPAEIKVEVPAPTNISISGSDKELVGQVAAKIRSFRPPEPYQGKGVKYENEVIRRKEGKAAGK
ncbi:ribosomal protein L6 [Chloroherpeton thalassium ATCC 35110]|uniref:Large ribosomal subunit protein uL6 n=1 Tax=Chloroherpeton thalassium (strain ATCC 35110 / GB-78) TaxID=517418 RepID=RL6_CHLT3|nr:50S ribosomal protein L6 [Chloroherpeton thalassium]B3QYD9.1 RecName: Full=Large ribosomal subunit protein uL6; AltName: Full=50S ribosomal protein L6 [Chloroherpeton thalassium ATCC 35110]ACF13567.1 ribosomal protein L6 [Chloroherpeton thalassium ATCC 35110]